MRLLKTDFNILHFAGIPVLCTILSISSCSDKNDPQPTINAKVKVINGIYGTDKFDVKLNGARIGDKAMDYRASSAYIPVTAAKTELTLTQEGTTASVLKKILDLKPGSEYSAYLVSSAETPDVKDVFVVEDEFKITAKKAAIRFVNVSPGLEDMELYMNGKPVANAKGISFKKSSAFIEIDPLDKAVFEMRKSGTEEILASTNATTIKEDEFFTLWAVGPLQRKSELVLGVIKNK